MRLATFGSSFGTYRWLLLAAFVVGCGQSGNATNAGSSGSDGSTGGTPTDPCEVANALSLDESKAYAPFEPGSRWTYRGSVSKNGTPAAPFLQTLEVTGKKSIRGIDATVVESDNPDGTGHTIDQYLQLTDAALLDEGNDDTTDFLTPAVVPYPELTLPLQVCSRFQQFAASGVDTGKDVDGDGRDETVDVVSTVTERAFETVVVPAGSYDRSLRLETATHIVTTGSRTGQTSEADIAIVDWYAPGVGPIKHTLSEPGQDITVELIGSFSGGTGHGVVDRGSVATGVASASSDATDPGRPAVGWDGSNFLVVLAKKGSGGGGELDGVSVAPDGTAAPPSVIAQDDGSPSSPALAFDGTNYLVVFESSGSIKGIRVSPAGTPIGAPFVISNNATGETSAMPAVAYGGGHFVVVYSKYSAPDRHLWRALVDSSGGVQADGELFSGRWQIGPAIAFDGNQFAAVWQDMHAGGSTMDDGDIFAARLGSDGAPRDAAPIAIATASDSESDADVAFDGSGFVLAWFERTDPAIVGVGEIHAARLGDQGAAPGTSRRIDQSMNEKGHPRIARLGSGAIAFWEQYGSDGTTGVMATRLGADGAPLDVSSTSEGLWISGPPPAASATRFLLPAPAPAPDRVLVVYVANVETSGQQKSLRQALVFP